MRGRGCIVDPYDPRDRPATALCRAGVVPATINMSEMARYGMSQNGYGACIGFGIANNVWIRQRILGIPKERCVYPSPWDIYYRARARARYPYGVADLGANPRNGWMTLRESELGVVPVENWPPVPPEKWDQEVGPYVNQAPDPGCYRFAADHKWLSFFYVLAGAGGRLDQINSLLVQGYPVSVRIETDAPYEDWTINDGAWKRTGTSKGGHYVCLVGREPAGYWHINSWERWGEGQLGLIAPEYIASDEVSSVVACEIDAEKLPW